MTHNRSHVVVVSSFQDYANRSRFCRWFFQMKTILRQSERGSIVLLPFYQVCCTQEAFNPAARCAHANHRVLPFINKTESSFLGCLASQKNFEPEQIGWPVSRFFASRFEVRKNWTSSKNFFRIVRKLARWKYNKISIEIVLKSGLASKSSFEKKIQRVILIF